MIQVTTIMVYINIFSIVLYAIVVEMDIQLLAVSEK